MKEVQLLLGPLQTEFAASGEQRGCIVGHLVYLPQEHGEGGVILLDVL